MEESTPMLGEYSGPEKPFKISEIFGRGDRIRTCDLLLPKQALYQAELRPE